MINGSAWGTPEVHQLLQTFSVEHYQAGIFPAYLDFLDGRKRLYDGLLNNSPATYHHKIHQTRDLIVKAMRTELPLVPHSITDQVGTYILSLVRVDDMTGKFLLGSGAIVGTISSAERGPESVDEIYNPFSASHFGLLVDQVVAMDDLGLRCISPLKDAS